MRGPRVAALLAVVSVMVLWSAVAEAKEPDATKPPPAKCLVVNCSVRASDASRHTPGRARERHSVSGGQSSFSYQAALRRGRDNCRQAGVPLEACGMSLVTAPRAGAPAPIRPEQAARQAVASLPLEPGKPTVGPPPELNKWKMAAVGYPLWIWAEGNLDPGPVSQTVSGLSVSLDASLAKIVYDMGDGTKITCGPGTPWHKGKVRAGAPSPDCGHIYSKPSLPRGSYTITATTYWSVAWTAGGQSGTIPFTQSSTTALPVGEVQTLVR